MITKEQEPWLKTLSDTDKVIVSPYNPKSPEVFSKIKKEIIENIGKGADIQLRGSSALKISGQGELDIYLPTDLTKFNLRIKQLVKIFGEPKSIYPLERARFITFVDGIKAEIFVINKDDAGWLNCLKFEQKLKDNPELLNKYQAIKEECNGLSTREYYRKKLSFLNKVLQT